MKKYIIISALIISAFAKANAQETQVLDTIYANDTKNVALFFPEPIRQGVTGSDNFVFTYNREKEQYFGLLQATPGKESNLLIINRNGAIFSYIVRYRKQLSKLNYFVSQSSSIGNEKPIIIDTTEVTEVENLVDNSTFYYTKFSSYLLERKQRIGTIQKRNESIVLSVENIVFDKEELYFVIQIENKSSLDYDLNFLNLSLETRQKGKRKSLQKLFQETIFKHNVPSRIAAGKVARLVYVMPKFSISNDRRLVVELNEKNGERDLKLKVSHKYINNPN
ncbi:DUF4138 domain-containing protein [Maribacter ulvicola]|uniref:Bacteroides conjugative transposon TraN protein n=1 Tax=Maribacter ulvicola TaxID=228959 RepID=A0A1N6Q9Q6_9FLAO|nr:DUF4138 domain-containing protein [Maribacter ulvicola]SIQ13383.1 protein of unknown function [Maribacter ulvicola]|tara:strand:- start:637 stop:1473 length:837 start_codon:yes stop_codon:yes gene_type:complete